jgi:hypothetical protein
MLHSARADVPKGEEGRQPRVLYRATHNDRKISTVVAQEEAPRFHANYTAVLKGGMAALKKIKKDKKKGKKAAAQ